MIKDTLIIEKRNVYGRELLYPVDETGKALVLLTGRKTFDEQDLETLRLLGFEIVIRAGL